MNAEFKCQIFSEEATLVSVALLNKKTLAAPYIAFVGYTLAVIQVLPP